MLKILPNFHRRNGLPRWVLFLVIILDFTFSSPALAVTTTISSFPLTIGADPFSVEVHIASASAGTNYLRIDLYKEGMTRYFGETHNGSIWYSGSDGKQYFPVTISSDLVTANFQGRVGNPSVSEYDGSGSYRLRVRRYTASGNYNAPEANASSVLLTINLTNPTPTPTIAPVPTATSTPLPSPTPTPSPTATPSPVSYSTEIYLNEFMANPSEGEREWVEIFNSNGDLVALTEWKIDDGEGGSKPQDFSVNLPARSFYQIFLTSNKLNNGGDTVRLLRPDSSVADSYNYSSSQKGISWAKNGAGNWSETSTSTPGGENKFTLVGGQVHKNNIAELKKLTLGSKIELEAFISVPVDIFSEDEFYVVDDYSGIKVSFSTPSGKKGSLGEKIRVSSTIEEAYNEKYIKTSSYEIISPNGAAPEVIEIATGEAVEANEGRLVKISGKYEGSDGDSFYINDGTGRVKVYLKGSTGIVKLKMSSGDVVEVTGVVSQYGHLKDGSPNFRLIPRYQSDLRNRSGEEKTSGKVLGVATELPRTGPNSWFFGLLLMALGLILRIFSHCRIFSKTSAVS